MEGPINERSYLCKNLYVDGPAHRIKINNEARNDFRFEKGSPLAAQGPINSVLIINERLFIWQMAAVVYKTQLVGKLLSHDDVTLVPRWYRFAKHVYELGRQRYYFNGTYLLISDAENLFTLKCTYLPVTDDENIFSKF